MKLNYLLAATDRPHTWQRRPKRSATGHREPTIADSVERAYLQTVPEQMGTANAK